MNRKQQSYIYKINIIFFLLCLCGFHLSGCRPQSQPVTYTDFYFDTVISLTFYNNDDSVLVDECFKRCDAYEKMFSRTIEGSDVWRINNSNGTPVPVSEETYDLIQEALFYCELTEGKIDITVAPLMDFWDFSNKTDGSKPPSSEEISALLAHVDYRMIELGENNTVTLKDPEAAIDLGFIAKGYIADRLKEYLVSQGVTSALINLGGNVCVLGNKPDGSSYTIGIQKPFAPAGTTIDTVQITDSSVVTSGTYERSFEYEGITYHHILDATTGYPADNTLTGVTIVCPSSVRADALSTTCFVLGEEQALKYINTVEYTECILINREDEIIYSSTP